MSKYNFDLNMSPGNSNSEILLNIKPNTKVLEIGCAHGRMTKYLKEILNCEVTIIEKDYTAGAVAMQWATRGFIGDEFGGDIEYPTFNICEIDNQFDYVIFADVLEHLHNPKEVLENVKPLLAANGSIWISIPNIAHNSVLIDLWNNKFEYREIGLLDNTHLRFFTESSLRKMIESIGLTIVKEINLRNPVELTEFKNSFDDVPEAIVDALKNRQFADIYQFVWELKIQ